MFSVLHILWYRQCMGAHIVKTCTPPLLPSPRRFVVVGVVSEHCPGCELSDIISIFSKVCGRGVGGAGEGEGEGGVRMKQTSASVGGELICLCGKRVWCVRGSCNVLDCLCSVGLLFFGEVCAVIARG